MAETIDWPPKRSRRRRGRLFLFALAAVLLLSAGTALSYYVDALWFESLGYLDVFWKTLNLQAAAFLVFSVITFLVIYGSFLAFKPADFGEGGTGGTIIVNGQPVQIPVGPALRVIALGVTALVALITGAGMMSEWPTLALAWYGRAAAGGASVDPIFGRPLTFYLFTLPALNLISGWLLTLAVIACGIAIFFLVVGGGARALRTFTGRRGSMPAGLPWRGLSLAFAALLLILAFRVYLGRFDSLFDDQTIFSGVNYTDAHVTLTGLLLVSIALVVGAIIAVVNAVSVVGWYVNGFVVKPNELVRETPYIEHNIQFTRQAFGLDRITSRPFPGDAGIDAINAANNRATLDNIRLWDWLALRDTLRQIQEIRTYYDFPDVDIDRYNLNGQMREVMLAARELNVEK